MDRAFLDAAYRRTTYRAFLPDGPCDFRIDAEAQRLQRLLAEYEATQWAYVTAFNPRSRTLSPDLNDARQAELEARLLTSGAVFFGGTSLPDDGTPGERSVLALIELPAASALATTFDQNAIVAGRLGAMPTLVWLR